MSLENFEDLSDAELHRKLLEYDFPNVPITETSRGVLIKKLKNHVKNLKSRNSKTQHFNEELKNLETQANIWEQLIAEKTSQSISIGTPVATRFDEPPNIVAVPLNEQNRIHQTQQIQQTPQHLPISTDTHSSNGYLNILWKLFGIQENCTKYIFWCLTLFFLAITFIYVAKVSELTNNINEQNTNFVICDRRGSSSPFLRPPFVCIDKEHIEPAIAVVRNLIEKLRIRSEYHFCFDHKRPKYMSVIDFIKSIYEEGKMINMQNIREAQYLITCNPQWKIDIVDQNEKPIIFNGVNTTHPNKDTFFVLRNPKLSLICLLYNKAYRFVYILSNVTFLITVIMLFVLLYCYLRRIQERRLLSIQKYLNIIVEELRRRAFNNDSLEGHIVIVNHLRDQSIPINGRKQELQFWNDALRELEEHESRVRFDLPIRDGEEFRTMRWVDNSEIVAENSINRGDEKSTDVETNC